MAEQSGPVYDDAMKALCESAPAALCRWLGTAIDGPGEVSAIRLSEVAAPPSRQVDALVAIGAALVVHIEFQSGSEARFGLRMLDYRLRLYHRPEVRGRELVQHVIMLGLGRIEEGVGDGDLAYRYRVHYVRDQPVGPLLADPGLAPLAALADVPDPERPRVLREALDLIATVDDERLRATLAYIATDLATLRLDAAIIDSTWANLPLEG